MTGVLVTVQWEEARQMGGGRVSPVRIQRQRTKGWRMPENTVYVGRPTKWGNPFLVKDETGLPYNTWSAVQDYRKWLESTINFDAPLRRELERELKSRNLACWCPLDQPCHADVLLEFANQ